MTDDEARAILNLHRTHRPSVIVRRGRRRDRYVLARDGRIEVYRMTPGGRAVYEYTTADRIMLDLEVRRIWFGSEANHG